MFETPKTLCYVQKTKKLYSKRIFLIFINGMFYISDSQHSVEKKCITREKLLNLLSYEKCTRKMLMKLTPVDKQCNLLILTSQSPLL